MGADAGPGGVGAAARALARGELVVVPTETVYGICARPDVDGATGRLFDAKRRPRGLNLPVLAATGERALGLTVGGGPAGAGALAAAFWPGPLTIVLRRGEASRGWDLGEERETIGVRVPDHPVALELLRLTGPLAVTSANISGERPARGEAELRLAFGDLVAVYLVGDPPPAGGAPSTVVGLTDPSHPRLLRRGALDPSDVRRAARNPDADWVDFEA